MGFQVYQKYKMGPSVVTRAPSRAPHHRVPSESLATHSSYFFFRALL
jgi:hypothetical protein